MEGKGEHIVLPDCHGIALQACKDVHFGSTGCDNGRSYEHSLDQIVCLPGKLPDMKARCKAFLLAAKGIDRDIAAQTVEALYAVDDEGEDPEINTARALVARQYAAKLAAGKREQVAAALARRGFSHGVIRAVLDEAAEDSPDLYQE